MDNRLKITFYTPGREANSRVVATFGVHIISVDLFLSKIKLVRKKDGELYAAPPAEKYKCPRTGQVRWSNFWFFGDKSSDFFQQECKKALIAYCDEKKTAHPWHPAFEY